MGIWKLSVDTGGTFTDCLCESPDGRLQRLKILSSSKLRGIMLKQTAPDEFQTETSWSFDPSLLNGYLIHLQPGGNPLRILKASSTTIKLEEAIPPGEYHTFEIASEEEVPVFAARLLTGTPLNDQLPAMEVRLGTTKGTNALLERRGARVILLVTTGFRDLLLIGNQQRPDLFALDIKKPRMFYSDVMEVDERADANGRMIHALTQEECARISSTLEKKYGYDVSIAIALLHSHRNDSHEVMLKNHLTSRGFSSVSCSSSLSSTIKILPRAQTTVVNSYLSPVMEAYFRNIADRIAGDIQVMNSAGHLAGLDRFHPKDSLLSGPAGGIKGAANIGKRTGEEKLVTFDMGGTSTDVSIYNEAEDYAYETEVGGALIQAPCLAIDTIAAGGGSICHFDGKILEVGPESAGAEPGPACYGAGGPLTVTDINFLAGRIVDTNFSIPLDRSKSGKKLEELMRQMEEAGETVSRDSLIRSLLQITTEKMAKSIRKMAIRKGNDPADFTLITFGGAGGQHACDLAEQLNIRKVIVPYDAGLLSAFGIRTTETARFEEREILAPWSVMSESIHELKDELFRKGRAQLLKEKDNEQDIILKNCLLYLRFKGQESTIEISYTNGKPVEEAFEKAYRKLYGHWIAEKELELTSLKVIVAISKEEDTLLSIPESRYHPEKTGSQHIQEENKTSTAKIFEWEKLHPGASIDGPAIIASENCTLVLKSGWQLIMDSGLNARLTGNFESEAVLMESASANLALFTNRYMSVVEEMGAILQLTSFSVNVKERVDFSCALLDSQGRLVVNAPHIPVHLGSMGICVRSVMQHLTMEEGDVIITNHPAYGGSHLPDITLIAPVFHDGRLVAYVANRAHHAEIGGKTPGSMPPDARLLVEEGVIIPPDYLLRKGEARWDEIMDRFTNGEYPSRAPEENIADLRGALASIQSGINGIRRLCDLYGVESIGHYMDQLYHYAGDKMVQAAGKLTEPVYEGKEFLDDGNALNVKITKEHSGLTISFEGTSSRHPGNLNATPAIVRSVVLYVLRLLLQEDLPLNEGLLRDTVITIPHSLLNPDFSDEHNLPAVAGGNTEVSQRLTDTILKALKLSACSYGTMNNIIFGNHHFGFYETICGGTGAGATFDGCDAVHQHMTNTRITDPELIEYRYPVRLEEFSILGNSGGKGARKGGNGVVRKIRFLENVELSVLTQHRVTEPYGMQGGRPGKPGRQWVESKNELHLLDPVDYIKCKAGDLLVIQTPGGGGWGTS